jgi:hypothetical protein
MKLHKIEIRQTHSGWYWHGKSRNGRILCDSGERYARRGTAIKYMEVATDATRRRIPVYATNINDVTTRL